MGGLNKIYLLPHLHHYCVHLAIQSPQSMRAFHHLTVGRNTSLLLFHWVTLYFTNPLFSNSLSLTWSKCICLALTQSSFVSKCIIYVCRGNVILSLSEHLVLVWDLEDRSCNQTRKAQFGRFVHLTGVSGRCDHWPNCNHLAGPVTVIMVGRGAYYSQQDTTQDPSTTPTSLTHHTQIWQALPHFNLNMACIQQNSQESQYIVFSFTQMV